MELDLFGLPVQPLRDRRGRPAYKKTPENQQFVMVRAAAGWTQEHIAFDMGIDPKTLRKNFSRELQLGAVMIEGQQLDVLSQKARQGNVSAIKTLREIIEAGQLRRLERGMGRRQPEPEPEEVLGKKEQAARDADEADKKLMEELSKEAAQGGGGTRH